MALTQVTSIGLKDGEIVNADLHSAAAIVLSKLNTTGTASSSTFLRGDGAWTAISADGGNAATLDSIDSSQFLRSDADDTASGKISFTSSSDYPVNINGSDDAKIMLQGSNNPYIRFRESSSNKAYIQWNASGHLEFRNQEDDSKILLRDDIVFSSDGSTLHKIWHAGNDGAGSGLDADTVDGFATSLGGGTYKVLVSESNGYLYLDNWIRVSNSAGLFAPGGSHLYNGGASTWKSWINQSTNSSASGIGMRDSTGTDRGWAYADTTHVGLLNAGGNWVFRCPVGNVDNPLTGGGYTLWHQNNDGAGSGLDADTLDGTQAAKFLSSYDRTTTTGWEDSNANFRINSGASGSVGLAMHTSNGTFGCQLYGSGGTTYGFLTANWGSWDIKKAISGNMMLNNSDSNIVWHAGNDGAGSGLDADSVDGIGAASFLRSDAGDSFTGGSLTISGNSDLRFSNGSWSGDTTKIQHHSNWLYLIGGSNGFIFRHTDGANRWQMNSSGHLFPSTNNTYDIGHSSYKINNGYYNWLYSDSADRTSTKPTRFYASDDAWLRYYDARYMRMWLGLSAKDGNYARRDYTSDTNYWVGAATNGTVSLNDCMGKGNVFWDTWSNPNGQPSGTSHWTGFNALHYTNRGTDGTSSGGAYGWQMTMGAGSPALTYLRGNWGSGNLGTPTWYKVWNESNDGSGSGLDADTVDGYEGSRLVINNSGNTVSGAPWELNNSGTSGWAFRFYNATGSNNYTYLNHGTHGPHIRNDSATNSTYLLEVYQSGASTFKVRGGDGLVTSGGSTMWHTGNDGSGSGLDADTCDGQHLGTSANVTFNNIYSNAWLRNNGNGEGLYNESSTQHFYSDHDDCWNVAGGSTSGFIRIRDENAGTIRGYVGANNSNAVGFLDYEGTWAWASGKFTNYSYKDLAASPDNSHDLGYGNRRWDNVYATNGTIQTSDRNEKENIVATDLGLAFVNKLSPVSFKRKGKTRTHYGFIAQDIEQIITDLGKTTTQFAPLIKSDISEAKDGSEYRYGLRYEQLLAPVVKAIQELAVKVAALESA